MLLFILALLVAVLPVYFVLAGFLDLTNKASLRRSIHDAFTASRDALAASMSLRLQKTIH